MEDASDVVNAWILKTEATIDKVIQEVVIELGRSVVMFTPVLTGRLRGNWQLNITTPVANSLIRYDTSGAATIQEMIDKARTFTAGEVAYIQNHVLYGYDIEVNNWSKKAPDGMIGPTVVKFARLLEQAANNHKEK